MSQPAGQGIAWIDQPGANRWGQPIGPEASAAHGHANGDGPTPAAGSQGRWGPPQELALPLADRGLQLAEGLFETIWLEGGRPRLLAEHLARWRDSADLLGMAPPPNAADVGPLLAEAVRRSGIDRGALRLNWSRGTGAGQRGLDLPGPSDRAAPHRFWFQLSAAEPSFAAVAVEISAGERRLASSRLSRCKTFAYGSAVQARREARAAGADDALLLSSDGQLSCGSCANLLLRIEGVWLTPDLGSGCLPGVMRARALAAGWLREAELWPEDLARAEAALLLNSLGCRPIVRWRQRRWPERLPADPFTPGERPAAAAADGAAGAQGLWRSLLDAEP